MVQSNDPFWHHVEEMKCMYCGHQFAKDTSISRIKWHLSGEKGHGVAICDKVTEDVQEAAFQAMHGGNKRHKSIASSSNVNDNAISTTPQEQNNNEVDNLAGDAGRTQAPDTMGQALERRLEEFDRWLMEDDIDNGTGGVVQPGAGASSSGGLTCNTNETPGDAVPTTKLVGQAFEDHKKTIWSWLMHDEVSTIGIYGMGGVGKTTLVTHIYNQLLERPGTFCHVYWITVSQDTNINKLQNSIAKRIGLDLSNEDEELYRASKLSKELTKKQKWVLILDDLWKAIELHKVGVPIQAVKGCKLIVTTRLENVCQPMGKQHTIKVEPISKEEAWALFIERLGHDTALSPEVEQIAKSVARECAGLPLGVITMAATMRGVVDVREWRNALEELRESKVRKDDMEPDVFYILRFSYNHLSDSELQQSFLYCALFPEDFKIRREDLIAYLIDEGVIKGLKSREAEFNKGHSILNKLERVCLLESAEEGYVKMRVCLLESAEEGYVKMHDLIRDMAIQILQENSQGMVKAGAQLRELPGEEEWTEHLMRVSLMHNQIKEIPSSHSPRCPSLSTLLLRGNSELQFIADSFFEQLRGLKVLDLSYTDITKLPDSVSELVSLTALLLIECRKIRHVPSLEKLRALKRLDLSGTRALEKIPQGMECLCNLRHLRMNGCGEKEFPSGLLPKLSHLQVFVLEEWILLRKTIVWGNLSIDRDGGFQVMFPKDIQQLTIDNNDDATSLCDFLSLIKNATELEAIKIFSCNSMKSLVSSSWFRCTPLPSLSYNGIFSGLKQFNCSGCKSMKKLFPLVLLPSLVNLEKITVKGCEKMEEIIDETRPDEEGVMGEETSSSNIEFKLPKLRYLKLEGLPELKRICSAKLICDSIGVIDVRNCEKMEEIISGTRSDEEGVMGEESSSSSITDLKLTKLSSLSFIELPELESICSAKLICDSLKEIAVYNCKKLKRMPICLPLLENGQPSPPPSLEVIYATPKEWWESVVDCEKLRRLPICLPLLENGQPSPPPSLKYIRVDSEEWWESVVEWEHPNAKDVLRPFVQ
eukprot:XP_024445357.1 probable disease resistance protein At4g27220 [Populus trichocarpa]